jgi:hypothetical protein
MQPGSMTASIYPQLAERCLWLSAGLELTPFLFGLQSTVGRLMGSLIDLALFEHRYCFMTFAI